MLNLLKSFKKSNLPKTTPMNWHVNFIEHIAKVYKPEVYVELGLYQCELFNKIAPYANTLFGVDISKEAGLYMSKEKKCNFFHGKTKDFAEIFPKYNLEIDLLFIDADHSAKSVKEDFKLFFNLVKENGLIILHDGYPGNIKLTNPGYCGDCYKAIEELSLEKNSYEMMTIPISPGVTICRKRTKHLDWI